MTDPLQEQKRKPPGISDAGGGPEMVPLPRFKYGMILVQICGKFLYQHDSSSQFSGPLTDSPGLTVKLSAPQSGFLVFVLAWPVPCRSRCPCPFLRFRIQVYAPAACKFTFPSR